MLRMEVVQSEIVADVERTLRAEFMSNLARSNRRDNHELMAEIFNYFDRATEARFIAALEERNKETADRIKALMFTFEDLAKLDPAGIQTLMRSAGNDRIAVALKGASEPLRDLFFKNMSERGRQDPARGHAGHGPGAAARRRGGAAVPGQHGQGAGRLRRDRPGRRQRR